MRRLIPAATDITRLVQLNRVLDFRLNAICGPGFKATARSNLITHDCERHSIRFGSNATVDGTVEVYERGVFSAGKNLFLGRSRIYCSEQITIGDYVLISDNVSIMDSDLHPIQASKRREISDSWADGHFPNVYNDIRSSPVHISNDVWIGFGASILKGVTIGEGAIVGAGSLVTSNVPCWTIVAGTPAQPIRNIDVTDR